MTNKEIFLLLVSDEKTDTSERAKRRLKYKKLRWLKMEIYLIKFDIEDFIKGLKNKFR